MSMTFSQPCSGPMRLSLPSLPSQVSRLSVSRSRSEIKVLSEW